MPNATVIEMRARPALVSHLCFEVNGILQELDIRLGMRVFGFNFPLFYSNLNSLSGDPSHLMYDSGGILNDPAVQNSILATLRAEPIKATLDRAIIARANAYFAKYANAGLIGNRMFNLYGPGSGAKLDLLQQLGSIATKQTKTLLGAYAADTVRNPAGSQRGVVATTSSQINLTGGHNEEELAVPDPGQLPPLPPGGQPFPPGTSFSGPATGTIWEGTTGSTQQILNYDYAYRTPYFESQAQGLRSTISLADQQFAAYVDSLKMPNISQIFQNELEAIDLDVKRLQVAVLNTILLTPLDGVVTGIYKNPGEVVRAGEPVIRVENNSVIFLLATVVYRGPIAIAPPGAPPPPNSTVTVQTKMCGLAPLPAPLTGTVVAVRGHRDDDTWELIVQCFNDDSSGNPIIPLGYHFGYDDTVLTIN